MSDPRAEYRTAGYGYDKNWSYSADVSYGGYRTIGFRKVKYPFGRLAVRYHVGLDRRASDPGDSYSMPAEVEAMARPTSGPAWDATLRATCIYVDGGQQCYPPASAGHSGYSYEPLKLDTLFPFVLGRQYWIRFELSGVAQGKGVFSWPARLTRRFTCRTDAASEPELRRRCRFG